jgi:ABC-2 type transport system permease protein
LSGPSTFPWFARQELRLAWRDWIALMTGGRRSRIPVVALVAVLLALGMHLLAYRLIGPYAPSGADPERATLILVTGCALLSGSLTLSQAMEMVTRAFYARRDLDLLLASPVPAPKLFAVRIAAIALSTTTLAVPLAAPFINALAWSGGPRWLAAYGVVVAMGMAATAYAVGVTVVLFRLIGARRTRLVAQIIAAIVGAIFVIGVQALAILSTNTLSRFAALQSDLLRAIAPGMESPFWWPARAIMGDISAMIAVLACSFVLLAAAIVVFANSFAEHATAAAGVSAASIRERRRADAFRSASPARILRRKEWTLLKRDPWLVSQTLMQVLYLLPPALLLWKNFGDDADALIVLVPVFVMAAGQLAGGLAWLAVSGEDAPDLVATAPVSSGNILRAKVEAVIGGIALVLFPFVAALALASPASGFVTAVGVLIAAGSATLIQLWFRTQAKRSHFRRRQTSSRAATFAEAFSSISWAAAAGLAANGTWLALAPGLVAFAVLGGAKLVSPR